MKKYILFILCFVVASSIGLSVYFTIPKENPIEDFVLNVQDVSVKIGEKQKLNYSVSIEDAVISVNISDKSIAKVVFENSLIYIQGCAKGDTEISLSATYRGETKKEVAIVQVSQTENIETPTTPEPSDDEEKSDENQDNGLNDSNETENSDITLSFSNLRNCSVEGNIITITHAKEAMLTITANINTESVEIEFTNSGLSTLTQDLGNRTFKFNCDNIGEFEFYVIVNSTYRVKCNLLVK